MSENIKKKAVFFDRDGTLIVNKPYMNEVSGIEYLEGVFQSLRTLKNMGYVFVVVTNQSGLSRGIVDLENLIAIHKKMEEDFLKEEIEFLEFSYSPHMPETNHYTRKPEPGMLENAALKYNIDLKQSWMVGDRMTDIEAGHRSGCKTIFITGTERPLGFAAPEIIVDDLLDIPKSISIYS